MLFLALGNELGSPNALSQKPQFLKIVGAAADLVAVLDCIIFHFIAQKVPFLYLQFVQIEVHFFVQKGKNIVNVTLDGVAFGGDTVMGQMFFNVFQPDSVVLIGLFQKDLSHQKRFVFLSFFLASWLLGF